MSDITSGDPLGGPPQTPQIPGATPVAPQLPGGYSSPPPPGAGGPSPLGFPNAPTGALRLASWGSRLVTAIVDGLVLGALGVALALVIIAAFAGSNAAGVTVAILGVLGYLVAVFLYAPVMMAQTNGKTLGRMATNTRVIRADGRPMTFGLAALREVVLKGIVSPAIGFGPIIDGLWPLWDDQNRAVHDLILNTRVVRD